MANKTIYDNMIQNNDINNFIDRINLIDDYEEEIIDHNTQKIVFNCR